MKEKAELEDMVDALKEVAKCIGEKDETEKALDEETEERAKNKERWKDRMVEEAIIKELEEKAEVAERRTKDVEEDGAHARQLEKRLAEAEGELEPWRAEKAERVLGGKFWEANKRVAKIMGNLRNAHHTSSKQQQKNTSKNTCYADRCTIQEHIYSSK